MDWTESDVKTWKRADKGGIVYVIVPGTAGWRSSGKRRRTEAVEWALNQAQGGHGPNVTFGAYAKDFFVPGLCRRVTHMEGAHGKNTVKHWDTLRQLLVDYAMPRWGDTMVAAITPAKIYTWLIDPALSTVKSFDAGRRPLSTAQRNKLRVVMKHVMDQAAFEGVVQPGVVKLVPVQSSDSREADTFLREELERLFPDSLEELDRIWGSRVWAALGMIERDAGPRPSEALALRWRDWHPTHQAFICAEKIDSRGQPGPLKSAKKKQGVKKKVLLVSLWTTLILEDLRARTSPAPEDLLFPAPKYARLRNQPMRVSAAQDHFLGVMDRAGVPRVKPGSDGCPRTQYCLRHGAATWMVTNLGSQAAQLLLGHTPGSAVTEVYDHPEDEDYIIRAKREAGR